MPDQKGSIVIFKDRSFYVIKEFVATVCGEGNIKLLGRHLSVPGGTELRVQSATIGRLLCDAHSVYLPDGLQLDISLDDAMYRCVIGMAGESRQKYVECHHRRNRDSCYSCFKKWWEGRSQDGIH